MLININIDSTFKASGYDWTQLKGYDPKYLQYFRNLKNPILSEIRYLILKGEYTLDQLVNSGVLDDYGCLKPHCMKKLRSLPQ